MYSKPRETEWETWDMTGSPMLPCTKKESQENLNLGNCTGHIFGRNCADTKATDPRRRDSAHQM